MSVEDGMGVNMTPFQTQTKSLASEVVLWAIGKGDLPLQGIIWAKIEEISYHKWGCQDYSGFQPMQNVA